MARKDEVKVCWGTPDTIYYIDKKDKEHEIDLYPYGFTFGIWDGKLVCSRDEYGDGGTCGMVHDDLITYYLWENGWGDILPAKEAYNNEVDHYDMYDKMVKYDGEQDCVIPTKVLYMVNEDEDGDETYSLKVYHDNNCDEHEDLYYGDLMNYAELSEEVADEIYYDNGDEIGDGWKELKYGERETYGEILNQLGSPELRGRVLMDYDSNLYDPLSFIAFWDDDDVTIQNIKKLAKEFGKDVYNYFIVTETNRQSASRYGLFNMPTLGEYLRGEVQCEPSNNSNEKEELLNIHLMKPQDKWKALDKNGFLSARNNKLYKKLAYRDHDGNIRTDKEPMTMAQYHNLIYQENKTNTLPKKILMTESQLTLLLEGAETKNMRLAKHYLYDNMGYNEQQAMQLIGQIKTSIPLI